MFQEGQRFGEYALIKKLGRGGFGEVWLAENESELFAIKFPYKDQVDWKAVTQEIGLWVLCGKHKNVLPLVGARNFNGQIAIISEYAPDGSLEDLLREKGKLSESEAVEMTIGILEGLQHLHESGIIHRDLKPANILLDGKTPHLTDFGISRIISADSLSETIAGTFAYMAPECFDGKRNVQTDIWAVGVILYRMLTGNLPFPRREQTALVGSIIMQEPEPLADEISSVVKELVSKTLSKNPSERLNLDSIKFDLENYIVDTKGFLNRINQRKVLIAQAKAELIAKRGLQIGNLNSTKLIPYRKGNKWGFCDAKKNILLEPKYSNAWAFSDDLAMVEINGKRGYIDSLGSEIIDFQFSNSWSFNEGLARVLIHGWCSFINKKGEEISENRFYDAYDFTEGLAAAKRADKRWGFIDKNGCEIIDFIYEEAKPFSEGLAAVKLNGKWGFIDSSGKNVTQHIFDDIWTFKEDLVTFSEGLARVYLNKKWGFINRLGEIVIDAQYEEAESFSEGLAAVSLDYNYGFINNENQFIIPPKYDNAKSFSENLAAVEIKYDKWGFINQFDKEVISFSYDNVVKGFENGLARVQVNSVYVPSNIPSSLAGQLAECNYGYIGHDGTEYFED